MDKHFVEHMPKSFIDSQKFCGDSVKIDWVVYIQKKVWVTFYPQCTAKVKGVHVRSEPMNSRPFPGFIIFHDTNCPKYHHQTKLWS